MRHAWVSRNWQERAAQKEILLEGNAFHVCVTTYETVAQEVGCLKKMSFEMLVIDEAHRLKNETSKLATLLRQLSSARRLLLTGTPIQNNLHELWALLNFLYPEGARRDAAGTHTCPRGDAPNSEPATGVLVGSLAAASKLPSPCGHECLRARPAMTRSQSSPPPKFLMPPSTRSRGPWAALS